MYEYQYCSFVYDSVVMNYVGVVVMKCMIIQLGSLGYCCYEVYQYYEIKLCSYERCEFCGYEVVQIMLIKYLTVIVQVLSMPW